MDETIFLKFAQELPIVVIFCLIVFGLLRWFSNELKNQREAQEKQTGMLIEHMEKSDSRYERVVISLDDVKNVLSNLVDRVGGRRDL